MKAVLTANFEGVTDRRDASKPGEQNGRVAEQWRVCSPIEHGFDWRADVILANAMATYSFRSS